jgi:hypothetical protein
MRQLETSNLSNQNLSAYLLVHTYTADADRAIFARIHIDQIAGGGDYSIYVTIQAGGVGSVYMEGPITTFVVPVGQTSIGFVSILLPVNTSDIVRFYVKGLSVDITTPDIVSRIFELTYLRPTVSGRTLDVTDTGEAGIDWANIHEPGTEVVLSGTSIKDVEDTPTVGEIDTQLSGTHGSGSWGVGNGGDKQLVYTLTDSGTGEPVFGAVIELYATAGMIGIIDSQVTNILGQVTFTGLVAGTYYLKCIKSGFVTTTDTEVVA